MNNKPDIIMLGHSEFKNIELKEKHTMLNFVKN